MKNLHNTYIKQNTRFTATLLIPASMEEKLYKNLGKFSKKNMYLRTLLEKYHKNSLAKMPPHTLPTTRYQNPGQDLVRFSFKTNGTDWLKLKMLAFHMRVSMSFLFVFMIVLDEEGCLEVKVPTFYLSLKLIANKPIAKSTLAIHIHHNINTSPS